MNRTLVIAFALVAGAIGCTNSTPGGADAGMDLGVGDLTGSDLAGLDLAGVDLAGADLAGADLAAAWTPKKLTGLAVWLEGDVGLSADGTYAGTLWQDQSGNGNDAKPPTFANFPTKAAKSVNQIDAMQYSTTTEGLTIASPVNAALGADFLGAVVFAANSTGFANPLLELGDFNHTANASASIYVHDVVLEAAVVDGTLNAPLTLNSAISFGNSSPHVGLLRRVGGQVQLFGDPASSAMLGDLRSVTGPIIIGGGQLVGFIAEVVVVAGTVSDSELAQLKAYLKAKYALSF